MLTGERRVASNALFVTLDPLVRRVRLPDARASCSCRTRSGSSIACRTQLVAAFRATLEEVAEAPICCCTSSTRSAADRERRVAAVESVLEEVGAARVPVVDVFNKMRPARAGSASTRVAPTHPEAVLVSASRRAAGASELIEADRRPARHGHRARATRARRARGRAIGSLLAELYRARARDPPRRPTDGRRRDRGRRAAPAARAVWTRQACRHEAAGWHAVGSQSLAVALAAGCVEPNAPPPAAPARRASRSTRRLMCQRPCGRRRSGRRASSRVAICCRRATSAPRSGNSRPFSRRAPVLPGRDRPRLRAAGRHARPSPRPRTSRPSLRPERSLSAGAAPAQADAQLALNDDAAAIAAFERIAGDRSARRRRCAAASIWCASVRCSRRSRPDARRATPAGSTKRRRSFEQALTLSPTAP